MLPDIIVRKRTLKLTLTQKCLQLFSACVDETCCIRIALLPLLQLFKGLMLISILFNLFLSTGINNLQLTSKRVAH